MTIRHQLQLEISSTFLAAVCGIALAWYLGPLHSQRKISLPVFQSIPLTSPTPTPSPSPEVVSQLSPDGTKKVTLTITHHKNSSTYQITTSADDDTNLVHIYSLTNTKDTLSLPFNSWSPDDTYFFLVRESPTEKGALVFRADGTPVTVVTPIPDVKDIFQSKVTTNLYDETTGWAADNLLVINSKTPDNAKSTSYWLELPDLSVIQLATQF